MHTIPSDIYLSPTCDTLVRMPPHNEHNDHEPRCVNADSQAWHITFGTYATRLHEDPRPTVDRRHNHVGTPFPPPDPARQQKPSELPLRLTREQREHIEKTIPHLCDKGGWVLTTCAAQPDHIHILLSAPHQTHGKLIRKWLKRWLSGSLTQTFGPPPMRWWSAGGSTKPVCNEDYFNNATSYINNQRRQD